MRKLIYTIIITLILLYFFSITVLTVGIGVVAHPFLIAVGGWIVGIASYYLAEYIAEVIR